LNLKKQISKRESTIDDFGYKTDGSKEYSPVDLKDRTVVGIDPNRKDLFMAYDGKQKFQVTGKEWRRMAGITEAKTKRENWLKKRIDIVNANSNVPTSKVSHVSDLHNHFFYLFAHLNLWFEFFGSRQWRQLRKRSSIKRQQALDLIVNRIIGKAERKCYLGHKGANAKQSRSYNNVFVAFGGGQFSSSSRGHHPIPRRSLINALKQRKIPMRLVDEFRTSMLCCKCKEPLPKRGMWHVKRCDNCNIFWNRDVNAAVNIREVFISVNASKGVRPGKFSRSYKFCSSTNT
jgi:transposase